MIRCFDVGVGRFGFEIQWLVKEIFPELEIRNYEIHGFEAWTKAYESATKELAGLSSVHVHRLAVCDREGECNLYFADSPDGHSIYASKNNIVSSDNFEVVPCTRLSVWIRNNIPDLSSSTNILRFNAEGAEWPLMVDLDSAGMLRSFQIVCGNCGSDISTVKELVDGGCKAKFQDIVARNNVAMFWFCWDTRHDDQSKAEMRKRLIQLI